MAGNSLFPVFDVPSLPAPAGAAEKKYAGSVYFDFSAGDFSRDTAYKMVEAAGRDAYIQWCLACVNTERGQFMAYSQDFGVELEAAMALGDPEAVKSAVERTITEALMVNPKTEYVRDFSFSLSGDGMICDFTVKGMEWEEQSLSVSIT